MRYATRMDNPVVISPTIQLFNGTRYYLCGLYFQRNGKRLHISVWEATHGSRPRGYHIHHENHDRADNRIENLIALSAFAHLSHHGQQPITEKKRAALLRSLPALQAGNARLTHDQRSRSVRASWSARIETPMVCEVCADPFTTPFPSRTKYCGLVCRQRALRARRGAKVTWRRA